MNCYDFKATEMTLQVSGHLELHSKTLSKQMKGEDEEEEESVAVYFPVMSGFFGFVFFTATSSMAVASLSTS